MRSGSIGITQSGRYTLVPRSVAVRKSVEPGGAKCDTSAICTPNCQCPLASRSRDRASSKSLASFGSMVTVTRSVRSERSCKSVSSNSIATRSASLWHSSEKVSGILNSLIVARVSTPGASRGPRISTIFPLPS